jgi:putative endopeptidase
MRHLVISSALLAVTLPLAAQDAAPPARSEPTPKAEAKRPLAELPYTPSLDVSSMDKATDPCVDFYQYSCGGWMKDNPIPPDQPRWDVYGKLEDDNQQFLWGLLEQASHAGPGATASERKIGDYFAACMDEAAIEKAGEAPLEPELAEIAGLGSKRDLAAYLGRKHLTLLGAGLAFGFGSNQDFEDSTRVIAFAAAGGLGLPDRDYYTKTDPKSEEIRRAYVAHVARMLELIGEPKAQAETDSQTVMAMETALAKASLTRVERRDPYKLFHKLDRAELRALTPDFDWDVYFHQQGVDDVKITNVTEPDFYKALDALIGSESLDAWKTYLRWHVVHARAPYLSKAFADADFDFYRRTLRGVDEQRPRWKKCVQWVDRDLGEALGEVFVARTFSPETKAKTVEMTKLVEEAMGDEIRALPWMSEATKKRALEKLGTIVNKVGYPDVWRDYSALRISPDDFLGNVTRSIEFESKRQLAKIGKPVDRGEWGMTPPTVNAYYNPQLNDINFPAGVLQPPLYDPRMDDAPNYGNTGATIGHELTHGFDDEGRQFDAQGNLKDWWTKQDAEGFDERLECVRDQYAQYVVVDDITINSKLTSGEDVADLGGTLLAYLAWRKATAGQKLEPRDGLTPEQRFFVGFAQWACGNDRPEDLRLRAGVDPHSPLKYRIDGVVSNLPEFAAAFACKAGQPMVRDKPCKVW